MAVFRLVEQPGRFVVKIVLARAGIKEQAFDAVDDAQVGHGAILSRGRVTRMLPWLSVGLNGNPQRLFANRRRQPRRRLQYRLSVLQRDGIPPPNADIHVGFGKEISAVLEQLPAEVLESPST